MCTSRQILIIDSNPELSEMIEDTLLNTEVLLTTVRSWEEANDAHPQLEFSEIVFGSGIDPEECLKAARTFQNCEKNGKPKFYYLCDAEPENTELLNSENEVTLFVIKRKSDLLLLRDEILKDSGAIARLTLGEAKETVGEVVSQLEKYAEEIGDSLRYASMIQQAFHPGEEVLRKIVTDSFLINKPKDIIGGDFFWYTVKYNRVIMAVADCTGHGIPGALLSMIGNNLLNTIVNNNNVTQPAEILRQLNRSFQSMIEKTGRPTVINDGMDISIVCIDPDRRTIDYSGARRPMMACVNGEAIKLKGSLHSICAGTPVSATFEQHTISFGYKDTFYLASDGICDQFGGECNKRLGTRKLCEIIKSIQPMNLQEQKKYIETSLRSWSKYHPQTDDIMVLGFRASSVI